MKSIKILITLFVTISIVMSSNSVFAAPYSSSVVGTDFDFITASDTNTFMCLEYKGKRWSQMPRSPIFSHEIQNTFQFGAYFTDGTVVDIFIDNAFRDEASAKKEAEKYLPRLGKLPTKLRDEVHRLIVHKGDGGATSDHGWIVLFSENADDRISTHDLEETVFHEAVHAAWDLNYRTAKEWVAAQNADNAFVSDYAQEHPTREDMAESALFAYTLTHHPERIPAAEAAKIKSTIPNRIAYIASLIPAGTPVMYQVAPPYACDKSDTRFQSDGPSQNNVTQTPPTETPPLNFIMFDVLLLGKFAIGDEARVQEFVLQQWHESKDYTDEELILATAKEYKLDVTELRNEIEKWRYYGERAVYNPAGYLGSNTSPVDSDTSDHTDDTEVDEDDIVTNTTNGNNETDISSESETPTIAYLFTLLLLLVLITLASILWILIKRKRQSSQFNFSPNTITTEKQRDLDV